MMRKIPPAIIFDIIALTLLALILIYASVVRAPELTRLASSPEDFRNFIVAYGSRSVLYFILFQALQVIVAVIPGEMLQVAGGYIFGFWWGTFYSGLGILLGSLIAFYVTRELGYPILRFLVPSGKIERFSFFVNSPRVEVSTFVLFLIPGLPKDILTYLAGLTPMQPLKFLVIAMTARLPGLLMSSYIGASLSENHYAKVILISSLAVFLFLLGYFYKEELLRRLKSKH